MKKINFTNATLDEQGYVEIGGETYNIVDTTYKDGTDLSAETFNEMQNNIEEEFDKIKTDSVWGVDANTLLDTRLSACSLAQNSPSGGTDYGTIQVIRYPAETPYTTQRFTDVNNGLTYSRVLTDGSWSKWEEEINKNFGKVLWSGNFMGGTITVPELHNYELIAVLINNEVMCYGTQYYGVGGYSKYASYEIAFYSYRFTVGDYTLTIDDVNLGGGNGVEHLPVTKIYGLIKYR